MEVQHYSKRGSPFQYIAARFGGPFDPLPIWFPLLEKTGNLRYDSEHNVEVHTITGAWRTVEQGDWVVLQRVDAKAGIGFDQAAIWHVEHEDFIKTWEKL